MPRGDRDNWGGPRPSRGRTGRKPVVATVRNGDRVRIAVRSHDQCILICEGRATIERSDAGARIIEIDCSQDIHQANQGRIAEAIRQELSPDPLDIHLHLC